MQINIKLHHFLITYTPQLKVRIYSSKLTRPATIGLKYHDLNGL